MQYFPIIQRLYDDINNWREKDILMVFRIIKF